VEHEIHAVHGSSAIRGVHQVAANDVDIRPERISDERPKVIDVARFPEEASDAEPLVREFANETTAQKSSSARD
jgi:hypothetical protein